MGDSVDEFFDRHAERYHSSEDGWEPFHRIAAKKIEAGLDGRVLCVGGLWDQATLSLSRYSVTIADLSQQMLEAYSDPQLRKVRCDALQLSFASSSVRHVVLPLIVHHIAGNSGLEARRLARTVFERLLDVVEPGGRLWISELCISRIVYGLELLAAPLTRRILNLGRQPLVIMHSAGFYRQALADAGWLDIRVDRIQATDAKPLDIVGVILAAPWLRVPRFVYPIKPTLISARRPA